jgi:large subunit ribosomal protein L4
MATELVTFVKDPIEVPVHNRTGTVVGTVTITPSEFSREGRVSRQLLHDVVLMYLANQRQGTHSTLRRGEVAGSTKKLFRQKGTGNARAGSKRTNKRRGGGTAKGPKPRDYEYHLPKKAVRIATRMALLTKFRDHEAIILDELTLGEIKTKTIVELLAALKLTDKSALFGSPDLDRTLYKSARNIPGVSVYPVGEFNTYQLLKHKHLILTKAALEKLRHPTPAPELAGTGA